MLLTHSMWRSRSYSIQFLIAFQYMVRVFVRKPKFNNFYITKNRCGGLCGYWGGRGGGGNHWMRPSNGVLWKGRCFTSDLWGYISGGEIAMLTDLDCRQLDLDKLCLDNSYSVCELYLLRCLQWGSSHCLFPYKSCNGRSCVCTSFLSLLLCKLVME